MSYILFTQNYYDPQNILIEFILISSLYDEMEVKQETLYNHN
jgi:hypothetical protein